MKAHQARRLLSRIPLLVGSLSVITLGMVASAQYTNPNTGRTFNNPISSYLDTVILNRMQQSMLNQQLFSQQMFNQMMLDTTRRNLGKERIAKGKASTSFTPSAKGSVLEALLPQDLAPGERKAALGG